MIDDVASTSPKCEFGKVSFNSMFLKRKKSQCFGALSFSQVSPHAKEIPLPPLGLSYSVQKNHFAVGRNSERYSYHTDLSRFVFPISDPSVLNVLKFVRLRNSQNRKSRGNVRIWWKRAADRRKNHSNLKKSFAMNTEASFGFCVLYRDTLLETAQKAVTIAVTCVHKWAQQNVTKKNTIWAFVFGFRNVDIWTLSQLSICSHKSDCSQ